MANVQVADYYAEIEAQATVGRRENDARRHLYDELSSHSWDNQQIDVCVDQAQDVFHVMETNPDYDKFSFNDILKKAVKFTLEYHTALIAVEVKSVNDRITDDEHNWALENIEAFNQLLDFTDNRANPRERDRGQQRREARPNRSRGRSGRDRAAGTSDYQRRRTERGYAGRSTPQSGHGDRIGRRDTGVTDRYRSLRQAQPEEPVESKVSYRNTSAASERQAYRGDPDPTAQRSTRNFAHAVQEGETDVAAAEPKEQKVSQFEHQIMFTPDMGKVAHELYDVRARLPLYNVIASGEEAGVVTGEIFINQNSTEGTKIMATHDHSGFLFARRRGPRTDDNQNAAEIASSVYRRLLQKPFDINEVFEQLNITETTITAKENAEFPTVMNRAPIMLSETIDVGYESTSVIPSYIQTAANRYILPLNPNFNMDQAIVVSEVISVLPLTVADKDDVKTITTQLAEIENRNSIPSLVNFMVKLEEILPLREWNCVNDALTAVANNVLNVEFGVPVRIDSFTTEYKGTVEEVNVQFGRAISELVSERTNYLYRAGLNTRFDENGSLEFIRKDLIVMLPLEACDLTIGLAHDESATGIVSQETFPDLHDALAKLIDNASVDIANVVLILQDGYALTAHRSPIGNSILLHRQD